ncbi:hypothetical protein Ddye_020964 [Dipteronia dyeriana]|uniref:AB hydrolase-1 domain-containing protein n=1 Tax=Dipteronia dyeriana TaxID=168575 RepID=A0AAD9U1S1_9ROSI|nr:hypothetical protein Ddye_020964 [Dipteronia dyeriana]
MVMPEQISLSLSTAMNVSIIGSGSETMVLAHGFGGDHSIWDKIIPFFSQHYKLFLFDWSFSGAVKDPALFDPAKYSSYEAFANDLITLLDENDVKSSVFVGHSMSGMIGCIASVKKPQLFKRLILVGASPRYINTDEYEGGFQTSDIEQIMTSIETNYHDWATGFASLVVDKDDPLSVEMFEKCLKRMRPEAALPLAKTVFYCDEREILEKVMIPCTIVQTSRDIVVPNSVAYYMQEKIKGKSTVEMIETSGHFPQVTAHQQFVDVLAGVLGLIIENK